MTYDEPVREEHADACEVCGAITQNVWWDAKEEPHAACFGRCEDRMWEQERLALEEEQAEFLEDVDLLGESA